MIPDVHVSIKVAIDIILGGGGFKTRKQWRENAKHKNSMLPLAHVY